MVKGKYISAKGSKVATQYSNCNTPLERTDRKGSKDDKQKMDEQMEIDVQRMTIKIKIDQSSRNGKKKSNQGQKL